MDTHDANWRRHGEARGRRRGFVPGGKVGDDDGLFLSFPKVWGFFFEK
jgi:hypothetical protein